MPLLDLAAGKCHKVIIIPLQYISTMRLVASILVLSCFSEVVFAQTYKEGNRIQAISHQVIIPNGGTLDELKGVVFEWTEGVLKACGAFEDVSLLYLESASDTLELLVLYELSHEEFDKSAQQMIQEQIAKKWSDQEEFQSMMKVMHKYIDPKQNRRRFYAQWIPEHETGVRKR